MASSVSRQDENPSLWLATLPAVSHKKNFPWKSSNKSFIDRACSVTLLDILALFLLWEFVDLDTDSVYKHAKKNLAYI